MPPCQVLDRVCKKPHETADATDDNDDRKDLSRRRGRVEVAVPHGRDRHDGEVQGVEEGEPLEQGEPRDPGDDDKGEGDCVNEETMLVPVHRGSVRGGSVINLALVERCREPQCSLQDRDQVGCRRADPR